MMLSAKGKQQWRHLAPSEKINAIQRVNNGESKSSVARDIAVPESILRKWCKNEQKLRLMSNSTGADNKMSVEKSAEKMNAETSAALATAATLFGVNNSSKQICDSILLPQSNKEMRESSNSSIYSNTENNISNDNLPEDLSKPNRSRVVSPSIPSATSDTSSATIQADSDMNEPTSTPQVSPLSRQIGDPNNQESIANNNNNNNEKTGNEVQINNLSDAVHLFGKFIEFLETLNDPTLTAQDFDNIRAIMDKLKTVVRRKSIPHTLTKIRRLPKKT